MIKMFNNRQWTVIGLWLVAVLGSGALLRYCGYLDLDRIASTLLEVSVPLMGFVLTTIAITSSVLGSTLLKRLRENGAYDSLISNLYYLLIFLFVGSIAGIALRHVNYKDLPTAILNIIDTVILLLLTAIFLLFWYASTRFVRMMKYVDD